MKHTLAILLLTLLFSIAGNAAYAPEPSATLLPEEIHDNSGCMLPFFAKLQQLEHDSLQTVNIIHIGDSHIQGGYLGERLRANFQHRFGNAGIGLITPLKIIKTNSAMAAHITSPNNWIWGKVVNRTLTPDFSVGIGGVTIETSERTPIFKIISHGEKFQQVRVFHHPQAPRLRVARTFDIGFSCPDNDYAYRSTLVLDHPTDTLTLFGTVSNQFNQPMYYGLSLESFTSGILYHPIGINGAACENYNDHPEILQQTAALMPDLIIISLGTNESFSRTFSKTYLLTELEKLYNSLKEVNPDCTILLTTPMASRKKVRSGRRILYTVNPNCEVTAQTISEFAATHDCAVWNLYEATGGQTAVKEWVQRRWLQPDHVHATVSGYNQIGDRLYNAVMKSYEKYKKK